MKFVKDLYDDSYYNASLVQRIFLGKTYMPKGEVVVSVYLVQCSLQDETILILSDKYEMKISAEIALNKLLDYLRE